MFSLSKLHRRGFLLVPGNKEQAFLQLNRNKTSLRCMRCFGTVLVIHNHAPRNTGLRMKRVRMGVMVWGGVPMVPGYKLC